MKTRKRYVVDKIVWGAGFDNFLHLRPSRDAVRKALQDGTEIPEHAKPGRAIMRLSEEEREELKKATSEDFQHWLHPWERNDG